MHDLIRCTGCLQATALITVSGLVTGQPTRIRRRTGTNSRRNEAFFRNSLRTLWERGFSNT